MNNLYTSYNAKDSSYMHTVSISCTSSNNTRYYDLKIAQDALNNAIQDYMDTKIDINYEIWYTVLSLDTIHKTSIPQYVEDALTERVYELDADFIEDMRRGFCCLDSYLREKAYDIAEQELKKALEDDFVIGKSTTHDELVEAIVDSIDFEQYYEIIDEIQHAPRTFEEQLRDVGMSTRDFL